MDELEQELQRAQDSIQARQKAAKDLHTELTMNEEAQQSAPVNSFFGDKVAPGGLTNLITGQPAERNWLVDVWSSVGHGALKGVKAAYTGMRELATDKSLEENILRAVDPEAVNQVHAAREAEKAQDIVPQFLDSGIDAFGAPTTKTGGVVSGISQFLVGMLPATRAAKGLNLLQGTTKATTALRSIVEGAAASATVFEGHDGNLANLVNDLAKDHPALSNSITEFLATDKDDTELTGRLKNALVDAGAGALFEGTLAGLKYVRGLRKAKAEVPEVTPEAPPQSTPPTPAATPKDQPELTLALDEPTLHVPRTTPEEITHDPRIKLETPEQETARLTGETPEGEPAAEPTTAPKDEPKAEPTAEPSAAEKTVEKAKQVQETAKVLVEESKPQQLGKLSPDEQYSQLRERLGISDAKMEEWRQLVKDGKVAPEKIGDLIGANPERIDWSGVKDAEDIVGMMNSLSRVFDEVTGEAAGHARVSLDTIAKQAADIGGSLDDAIRTWEGTRNLASHVQAGRAAVMGSAARLTRLAKKIVSGDHTPQDLLEFVEHDRRHALLQTMVRGTRAEIGRALRVMREGVQVSEASLTVANGRRLRVARRAQEVADKAAGAVETAKKTRVANDAKVAAEETAKAAKAQTDAAEKTAQEAEQKVTDIEGIIKEHEATREANARAAANKAAHELDVNLKDKESAPPTLREQLDEADAVVRRNRLEQERAGLKAKADEARKAAREAADKQRAADKEAAQKAKEAKAHEDLNAKAQEGVKGADVTLSGDLKMSMHEVEQALSGMGMTTKDVTSLADMIAHRESLAEVNAASRSATWWETFQDRISSLYINNILSGLSTQMVNFTSGLWKVFESTAERYGSAMLGGNKYDWMAANKAAVATFTSWRAAWTVAGKAWKEGLPQTDVIARAEVAGRGGIDGGVVSKVLSAPSRGIMTIDEFFKHIFYQQEINQRAVEVAAAAARLQPNPTAAKKMFDKVLKDTLDHPPDDIRLDAIESSRYNTFQSDLESSAANGLVRWTNGTPILKLIVPFVKTPVNVLKQGVVERSPIAALTPKFWRDVRAGGRTGREAVFRAAMGTAAIGTVWSLADQGRITGSKVGRPGAPNSADIESPPPYSIKVGDTWYQYNRIDPIGTLLGLTTDIRLLVKERSDRNSNAIQSDDMEVNDVFGHLMGIMTENLTDKTFFKGVADFTKAVDSGTMGDAMSNWVTEHTLAMVPFSSLSRGLARSHDDYAREAFSITDKLMQDTPGLSEKLPLKNDFLGRPIKNPDRLGPDWVSPFVIAKDDADPIAKELSKLEMNYHMPDKDIAGIKLDAEQYSHLTKERGTYIHDQLTEWVKSGEWAGLTRAQRTNMVRKWVTTGGRLAEQSVMDKWPKLGATIESRKEEVKAVRSGEIQ
jgi:hypothetical protein